MNRALVTGHSGFTGRHLVSYLDSLGYSVTGLSRSGGGDIRDAASVSSVVQESQPDVVFHLAAASKGGDLSDLYSVGVIGSVNLLEAIAELAEPPILVLVSSSAVYGKTSVGRPIAESIRPRPITHHGASKLIQEEIAMRYVRARRLPIIRVRTFNLLGPGLSGALACGAFAEAIARIERNDVDQPIRTGNLGSMRDFTDVRDVVRAYVSLAERGRPGSVYNVCSAKAVSLRYCLDVLIAHASKPIQVELDPGRIQAEDLPAQLGDYRRLKTLTGWEPLISVEQSLADMLEHERANAA